MLDAAVCTWYDYIMQHDVAQSKMRDKTMKISKILCRHWYNIGIAVALCAFAAMTVCWNQMSILLRFNTISFIAMLVHQFEEYGFPGGEPMIMNRVLQGSDIPNRYPLNQFSAMFTNVFFSYVIYLLPILFPNVIWLGIAPMLMGMMQFIVHGIMTNLRMKSIYNPGLGAVVFLHIPVGICYFRFITDRQLADGMTWAAGIVYTIIATGVVLGFLTYVAFSDRNSPWCFDETELKRFDVEKKITKKNIDAGGRTQLGPLAIIEKLKGR